MINDFDLIRDAAPSRRDPHCAEFYPLLHISKSLTIFVFFVEKSAPFAAIARTHTQRAQWAMFFLKRESEHSQYKLFGANISLAIHFH